MVILDTFLEVLTRIHLIFRSWISCHEQVAHWKECTRDILRLSRWPVTGLGQWYPWGNHLSHMVLRGRTWGGEAVSCEVYPKWRPLQSFPAKRKSCGISVCHGPTDTEHADLVFCYRFKFSFKFFNFFFFVADWLPVNWILKRYYGEKQPAWLIVSSPNGCDDEGTLSFT